MISIIIPTLGNLEYLKLAIRSIHQNTKTDYEILVHANQASREMIEYLKSGNAVDFFTHSSSNLGIAAPTNKLAALAQGEYVMYSNDDIYVAPGWDTALLNKVNDDIPYQYLNGPLFEPLYENVCMNSPISFGTSPEDFEERRFLDTWMDVRKIKQDIISPWGPVFVKKALWDEIKGFDEQYFPGFGTDPDIVAKIYFKALKEGKPFEFRGVADCGMYHFQCVTTKKLDPRYRDMAKVLFISKWKMEPMAMHKILGAGKVIED